MFKIGDLVYTREIKNLYWQFLSNRPGVVVEVGPQNRFITVNIEGQDVAVLAEWIEKRIMEGSCTK